MRILAVVFAALLLPTSVHAEGNVPPSMLRIDGPATVYAPAIRVDPPGPQPVTVEDIIRSVWPDQLEDRAVRIAYRESRFVPTVHTSCCYGVFEIHWAYHRGWMAEFGVTSVEQLYDPLINAEMAYQLYLRNGWSPWNV